MAATRYQAVTRPSHRSPAVAVVMLDTRAPSFGSTAHGAVSLKLVAPATLAFFANIRWACKHGYDALLYRLGDFGCTHPTWGRRHPSYCKLSAVAHAMALGYRWLVFFDSDALVRESSLSLEQLLARYHSGAAASSRSRARPSVFFAWDTPYSLGPNAGCAWRCNASNLYHPNLTRSPVEFAPPEAVNSILS